MKLINGNPNELGAYKHGQIELTEISLETRDALLKEIKGDLRKEGLEPYNLDCEIIISGMFKRTKP